MAGYVNHSKNKQENIIYQTKVHWMSLVPHVLLMIVFIGFVTIIPALIRFFTTELGITNKRVIGKVGLINTKSLDSPLNKVNNVSVSSGLLGKIFGYGVVSVTTSSGSYLYKSVAHPEQFKEALLAQIDQYEEDRIKRQAQEMAYAMKGVAN